jgi:hypothetical protein
MTGSTLSVNLPAPWAAVEEPISLERRCQVPGCRSIYTAPSLDELCCGACRRKRRKASPPGQSLYSCTAALCAGV